MNKKELDVQITLKSIRDYFKGDYEVIRMYCDGKEKEKQNLLQSNHNVISPETTRDPNYNYPINTEKTSSVADVQIPYPQPTSSQNSDLKKSDITENIESNDNEKEIYFSYHSLAIPLALTSFSIIEIIGFLQGTHKPDAKNSTSLNFHNFFMGNKYGIGSEQVNLLNWLFRQGLSHSFFPKYILGITYEVNNNSEELFIERSGTECLNVKFLVRIIFEKLDEMIHNSNLILNNRYIELCDFGKNDYENNKDKFVP